VQLAARLCGAAASGTVVSTAVRELCIGKRLEFDCSGPIPLKGFPEPVQIHQVIWQ
jgi:class 3 adenylate cyclase